MISRRDALKLGAAGLVSPVLFVGCGSKQAVLPDPDQPIAQTDLNDILMFRGGAAHTGVMPEAGPSPSGHLVESWDITIYNFQHPLLVSDGVLYAFLDHSVRGLDADTGAKIFEYDYGSYDGAGLSLDAESQAVVNNILYCCLGDTIRAMDITTGVHLWDYKPKNSDFRSLTISSDTVYTVVSGELIAIDRSLGKKRWKFKLKDAFSSRSPAFANGSVFAASGGVIQAVDSRSGKEKWTFPDSDERARSAGTFDSPTISDGIVFGAWSNGTLYAIDEASGEELWHVSLGGEVISPAVNDGVAYAMDRSGNLHALDIKSGSPRWKYSYADSDRYLILIQPMLADGVVYIVPNDHTVVAVDAETGEEIGRMSPGSDQTFDIPPLISNGHLYVSWFGDLHAIQSF